MRKRSCVLLSAVFIILLTQNAHALHMEYYTWGGFGPVTSAFQKIALIFSDSSYKGLFFSVIILGMLFGAMAVYLKIVAGVQISPAAWFYPVLLGVVIYLALVVPRGSLTIYDPVLNRFQTVSDLPDGIVAVAGLTNLVERGLVSIVEASSTPSLVDTSGGIGYQLFVKISGSYIKLRDQYVEQSLKKYINDCVFFELMRPGTALSVNQFMSNTDFMPLLADAQNPANYTVWYDEANKTGITLTCTEAYVRLSSYLLNPANLEDARRAKCALAGFNPANAQEYQRCREIIEVTANFVTGISITSEQFIRQAFIAQTLNDVVLSVNPDLALRSIANLSTMSSGIGIGLVANEWIPVIRAVITAVAVGLVPFLAIFIPTPLAGKAVSLIAGFFIWLTAWGVTDAVVQGIASDFAYGYFEGVRQNQLGFASMMMMPGVSEKALAMFGLVRSSGIMLATVITAMMIRFGGHALASLAGTVSGSIQAQGASAGSQSYTPAGQADVLSRLEASIPTVANAGAFSYMLRTQGAAARKAFDTGWGAGLNEAAGQMGVSPFDTGGESAQFNAGDIHGKYEAHKTNRPSDPVKSILSVSKTLTQQSIANTEAFREFAVRYFKKDGMTDDEAVQTAQKAISGIDVESRWGGYKGLENAYERAQKESGFKGTLADYVAFQKEVSQTEAFQNASVQKELADRYYDGNLNAMTRDLAVQKYEEAVSAINRMRQYGWSPELAAQYTGAIRALKQLGQIYGYGVVGDRGVINMSGGELMNEVAKFDSRRMMARITGMMKDDDDWNGFYSYLRQSHGQDRITLNAIMAKNINEYMHKMGIRNFSAKAGDDAYITVDPSTGRMHFALVKRGGSVEQYDIVYAKSGSGTDVYHGSAVHHYGVRYDVGNDTLSVVVDGNSNVIARSYSDIWYDRKLGRVFMDHVADKLGGYAKIANIIQNQLQAQASAGVDISKSLLGTVLGIKGGAGAAGSRDVVNRIDANKVRFALQNYYERLYDASMSKAEKNRILTGVIQEIMSAAEQSAKQSSLENMFTGVPDVDVGAKRGLNDKNPGSNSSTDSYSRLLPSM